MRTAFLEHLSAITDIGNGIALAYAGTSTGDGNVYRSTDHRLTWTVIKLGAGLERVVGIANLGNGVVFASTRIGTSDGYIYRSTDYGLTWTKLVVSTGDGAGRN